MFVCFFVCSSACPTVNPSLIHLSTCLYIYPSINLQIYDIFLVLFIVLIFDLLGKHQNQRPNLQVMIWFNWPRVNKINPRIRLRYFSTFIIWLFIYASIKIKKNVQVRFISLKIQLPNFWNRYPFKVSGEKYIQIMEINASLNSFIKNGNIWFHPPLYWIAHVIFPIFESWVFPFFSI